MNNIQENTISKMDEATIPHQVITEHARSVSEKVDATLLHIQNIAYGICFIAAYFVYLKLERFAFIPSLIEQQLADSVDDAEFDQYLMHLDKMALLSSKTPLQEAESSAQNCEKAIEEILKMLEENR